MEHHNNKMIVLGLDGATWRLIQPWAESNQLPNFKKLMDNGSWGNLKSTYPPITPPAWTSMTTGKNPAKHGIFGFLKLENEKFRLYQSKDKKEPEIWDYLQNKKSIVINLPVSYPPKKINGIMVSGMYTPSKESNFAHPSEIKDELLDEFPDYRFELSWGEYTGNKTRFLDELYKMTDNRMKLFNHLFDKKEWDLMFYVFIGTDRIQHIYWDQDELLKYYKYIDTFLGEVVEKIERQAEKINLFIVSDHGFNQINKTVDINKLLYAHKFLVLKKDQSLNKKIVFKIGINKSNAIEFIKKMGLLKLYKRLPNKVNDFISKQIPGETNIVTDISKENSRAYSNGFGTVFFTSNDGNDEIINKIQNLKDPENGRNVIKEIHIKRDLFSGRFIDEAPDAVLIPCEGYKLSKNSSDEVISNETFEKADHEIDGILLAYGPDIKCSNFKTASIYDIAPTILHLFGSPIPDDMDGRVLKEIFKETSEHSIRNEKYQESFNIQKLKKQVQMVKKVNNI
ncbi:MAG TPA: hypothetical protein C5S50_01020 [Methanosarcinaceae archaeon]|nr:hypothetical protein [Methanosarcinaceae archaeon]HJH30788.1 hypothetical protein [Methanosarcinaceae archaeon]